MQMYPWCIVLLDTNKWYYANPNSHYEASIAWRRNGMFRVPFAIGANPPRHFAMFPGNIHYPPQNCQVKWRFDFSYSPHSIFHLQNSPLIGRDTLSYCKVPWQYGFCYVTFALREGVSGCFYLFIHRWTPLVQGRKVAHDASYQQMAISRNVCRCSKYAWPFPTCCRFDQRSRNRIDAQSYRSELPSWLRMVVHGKAKAHNSIIKLYGLKWGAPGWFQVRCWHRYDASFSAW